MSQPRRSSASWPFILILAALFAATISAPLSWYPSTPEAAQHEPPAFAPPAASVAAGDLSDDVEPLPAFVNRPPLAAPQLVAPQPRVSHQYVETPSTVETVLPVESLPAAPLLVERFSQVIAAPVEPVLPTLPLLPNTEATVTPAQSVTATIEPVVETPVVETPDAPRPVAPEAPMAPEPPVAEVAKLTRPKLEDSLPQVPSAANSLQLAPVERPQQAEPQAWWPYPEDLIRQLEGLKTTPAAAWAGKVRERVVELSRQDGPRTARAEQLLGQLHELVVELNLAIPKLGETAVADQIRRTGFALTRRLDLWTLVPAQFSAPTATVRVEPNERRLELCLNEVRNATQASAQGAQWRDYLLIDPMRAALHGEKYQTAEEQQEIMLKLLQRLERGGMNAWHRQFASATPLDNLRQELRRWVHEPTDIQALLWQIEKYEHSGLPSDARHVAYHLHHLIHSPIELDQQIARGLETHYRNSNLRVTFTPELINRMMPAQDSRSTPVNDTVLGHPTRGWSTTQTNVLVKFIPDPNRIRMALEARGKIFAQTYTVSGPVTAFVDSDGEFVAAKEFRLDMDGLNTDPTEVEAATFPRLKKIQSSLDFVPLVRSLVRGVAKSEYEDSQPKAQAEASKKIKREVRTQLDQDMVQKLQHTNGELRGRLIEPLVELGLAPQLIESQTTEERITMRVRLSSEEQLAGHGPRPRAPAGCLASMQIHESALNNVCQQLEWEGKTYSVLQLRDQLSARLKTELAMQDEDNLEDLFISFAPENAVRLRCQNGRAELCLAIAKLQKGNQVWKNFVVKVHYKPDLSRHGAPLVRDGNVQLAGTRLNLGSQIILRGVFSKAFPPSRTFKLWPDKIIEQRPGMANVEVVQCDIRDGWIGMALGTKGKPQPTPQTGHHLQLFHRR